ncbi:MAG: sterol desaturase family protein [Alphaproteobacteria bacterium]
MDDVILNNQTFVRLGVFAAILALMIAWEWAAPRRQRTAMRRARWPSNLAIVALNTFLVRLVFPTAAVALALIVEERGWGLLNNLALPTWLKVGLAVVVLDFALYLQHVMFHAVPALWRLHRMHHADLDVDVTTGTRFHPLEILPSMGIKMGVVAVLGPPAVGVVIFEVLLNATSMFNHGNVHIPPAVDRAVRWFVVTPDMHRVHHSIVRHETNSNFGFNLPWWDRLLGTYRAQPGAGHQGMTLGIEQFREPKHLQLQWMLVQPFLGQAGAYPIGRREGGS